MSITRVFLNWDESALKQTAGYLHARWSKDNRWDLHDALIVLPTAETGRRLLEILVEDAATRAVRFVPPRLITLRELPELLYSAKRPFADRLTQQFAWVQALKSLRSQQRSRLMRVLPDTGLPGWLSFAGMLSRLHRELVANNLNFADVAEQIATMGEPHELARWELLKKVEQAYLKILDDLGLWDRQTARLVAWQQREFQTDFEVVLLGLVDLNAAHRAMFDQIASRVTALIVAPQSRAGWFDDYGGLRVEPWKAEIIPNIDPQIRVVDSPDDQALAACEALASWKGQFRAEEITIGVPDRRIAPAIAQRLSECRVPVNDALGEPVLQSGPARVLSAAANLVESQWMRDFANFSRHSAVERWLAEQGVPDTWMTELDEHCAKKFPSRIGDTSPTKNSAAWRTQRYRPGLAAAIERTDHLLRPLRLGKQPVFDWVGPIREILRQIYGIQTLSRITREDQRTWSACETIQDVLASLEDLPAVLAPKISGPEALRLLLRELEGRFDFSQPQCPSVTLSGWLELSWDDAHAVVVTGMNEGILPANSGSDAFLSNSLRRQMNLDDNDRRLARDRYALSVLAASKKALRLIVGRRTAENDPLIPSRLLFSCEDEQLPARVQRLFSQPVSLRQQIRLTKTPHPTSNLAYEVPKPEPLAEPVTAMRVTEFSAYLECPYRYYLAHRLNLRSIEPSAEELPPNAFGDVLHDVVEAFGRSPDINTLIDPERIYEFLSDTLDTQTRKNFGRHPLPAVRVQIEQARLRLKGFAEWQAKWASEGWELRFAEENITDQQASLAVDGKPMYLKGRIDRIDVREQHGQLEITILDYKTSDAGYTPEKKHRDRDLNWTDLQLPLYRHLIEAVDGVPPSESVGLGYILLPKKIEKIGAELASWTPGDLEEADEAAAEVIRCVRREAFWPPKKQPRYFSEYAAICQDDLFGAAINAENSAE